MAKTKRPGSQLYTPELEIVDKSLGSLRYLEHGWPSNLCRWHSHEEYELHLIVQTHGKVFIGDYIGTFTPASLYLVGPFVPHNWVSNADQPAVKLRDMLVQFRHDSLVDASIHYPELQELEPLLDEAVFGIEFVGFDAEYARDRLASIRDNRGMRNLLTFFEFMLELAAWPKRRSLAARPSLQTETAHSSRISHVVDYVLNNYSESLSQNYAAEIAQMHPSAFSRFFQRSTGNRFTEFITQIRIGHACELLMQTDQRIADIAEDVGFNSVANFNRHFQRVKGMQPREYRLQARGSLAERQLRGEPAAA